MNNKAKEVREKLHLAVEELKEQRKQYIQKTAEDIFDWVLDCINQCIEEKTLPVSYFSYNFIFMYDTDNKIKFEDNSKQLEYDLQSFVDAFTTRFYFTELFTAVENVIASEDGYRVKVSFNSDNISVTVTIE